MTINPVMNSFYETCRFLEQEKAFESGGAGGNLDAESDQSSDDRTNDMNDTATIERPNPPAPKGRETPAAPSALNQIGSASCRERVCPYVYLTAVDGPLQTTTNTKRRQRTNTNTH